MANFDDEISGYIQARSASQVKEKQDSAAANAAADALFGPAIVHPHPEGFQPTPEAPAFALNPVSQLWHDATTGTFSFYNAESETYVPVDGPDSLNPLQQRHQHSQNHHNQQPHPFLQQTLPAASSYDSPAYHIDPYTGYVVEPSYGDQGEGRGGYEAPPESDATLRLCVLASNILKVGGVILMDASGLSFGRDRPLSGQGKRVRMVEMEISRFHASIYLDRQQIVPREEKRSQHPDMPVDGQDSTMATEGAALKDEDDKTPLSASEPATKEELQATALDVTNASNESGETIVDPAQNSGTTTNEPDTLSVNDQHPEDKEDGELPDSPSAGARDSETLQSKEDGGHDDKTNTQQDYMEYQRQMAEYQQYYQQHHTTSMVVDVFQIVDCGSTHGTFLNGERLSTTKTASQPFPLKHLDQLQLGSTVFEVHAHEEGKICGTCQVSDENEIEVLDDKDREPDAKAAAKSSYTGDAKLSREQERIDEMNRLKKKWAGPDKKAAGSKRDAVGTRSSGRESPSGYVDRAAKRRMYNPDKSSPTASASPYHSSAASAGTPPENASGFHVPVAMTNKGHTMLSKMGWKAGTGLGIASQGVVEPVQLMVADKKAGLGSGQLQSQGAAAASSTRSETQGEAARRRARERFAQLK
ncbi:hypothetical protein BGZ70_004922 [Mortierella alpina]|uniref:G-patch domain-containing protein n=1 Tax=Mortierella alpina TaxID=64518 RepID=A0A9P6JBQ3_MORAP|nr:hypothetical protein BGZ70_004922 [Mortierella alpina]